MKLNKIVAFTMAMTMVLGSSLTALADGTSDVTANVGTGSEKEITGTGTESYVNKNVMKVTVPTTLTALFDYKLDPQGIVAESGSYDGVAVEGTATGIVFKNAPAQSGGKTTISNVSDPVKVTNKSSIPVEMGITVALTAASGGLALDTLADSADFTTTANATKAIYLGLKSTNDNDLALKAASTTSANILLSGADQYETVWDTSLTTAAYNYKPKSDAAFDDFEFSITGGINKALPNSTWATVDTDGNVTVKNPPAISVKFTLTAVKDALPLGVGFVGDDLYFWQANAADLNKDGGFGTTKPTGLTINGKSIATTNYDVSVGYGVVTFDKIAAAFGVAAADIANLTAEQKAAIKAYVKAVKATTASATYYGEL